MTDWKIIDHTKDHVTVEFEEDGEVRRLNFDVSSLVGRNLNGPKEDPAAKPNTGLRHGGAAYSFDQGAELPAHAHDAATLHNIDVVEGTVLIRKASGDVTAKAGDTITIAEDEMHSVHALTPARTVHWLVSELGRSS